MLESTALLCEEKKSISVDSWISNNVLFSDQTGKMSGRRIRLDLGDFVLDIGSHRWMFLSDVKFSTMSDLVEKLKEEYTQLEEEDMVQVFMDGDFVIPPWESIQILQSGDLVRVVRTTGKNRKGQD